MNEYNKYYLENTTAIVEFSRYSANCPDAFLARPAFGVVRAQQISPEVFPKEAGSVKASTSMTMKMCPMMQGPGRKDGRSFSPRQ
jgi:hypothetical protein